MDAENDNETPTSTVSLLQQMVRLIQAGQGVKKDIFSTIDYMRDIFIRMSEPLRLAMRVNHAVGAYTRFLRQNVDVQPNAGLTITAYSTIFNSLPRIVGDQDFRALYEKSQGGNVSIIMRIVAAQSRQCPPSAPSNDRNEYNHPKFGRLPLGPLTKAMLKKIPDKLFEHFVAAVYRRHGWNVEVRGRAGDGGVDIIATLPDSWLPGEIYIQAKRYKGRVDPHHVRDLNGTLEPNTMKGILVTTGHFSKDVHVWAKQRRIELVDGDTLMKMLHTQSVHTMTDLFGRSFERLAA